MLSKLLLLIFLLGFSTVAAAEERPWHLTIGGIVRLGDFDLTHSAKKDLETPISYEEDKLEDALGKFLFFNLTCGRFGVGVRWMRYLMGGSNSELEQTLDLTYTFITTSYIFFQGNFLHPKLDSQIGLAIGNGQNHYKLTTKSNEAITSQTVNESVSSSANAILSELFFNAVTRNGWGYRLGFFAIQSIHSRKINNSPIDGSSEPYGYLSLTWRY